MALTLESSVALLPGVGPVRAAQLHEMGIQTLQDLLDHVPFRYEQVRTDATLAHLPLDTMVCVKARVISILPIRQSRFSQMIKAQIEDETGKISLTWFHNTYILTLIKKDQEYFFLGKTGEFKGQTTLINPTVSKAFPISGNIIPIYHETPQITSKFLHKLATYVIETLEDFGEDPARTDTYKKLDLPSKKLAYQRFHALCDEDTLTLAKAKKRLAFDELYTLIRTIYERKKLYEKSKACAQIELSSEEKQFFLSHIPYTPTPSQLSAIDAINADIAKTKPMHRLLQGEVGSGKTLVATFALYAAARAGKRAYLVCPTNILAQQHFASISALLSFEKKTVSIGLYTGKEKDTDAHILIGTHALFGSKKIPDLVIIDEEHRFGVAQRDAFFTQKKKPHFLSMTATPIPRTVALTALSDRDISFIAPHKSSSNIHTWLVPPEKRTRAYAWMRETLEKSKQQAFIVCPFIEESQVETLSTVKSAKKEFDSLRQIFLRLSLALLHGTLTGEKKDHVFQDMMAGKIDILVTTPVVEVGVDIPGAAIIVIEGAERYGLAALHQLRGRVGRRGQEAYCLLFVSESEFAKEAQEKRLTFFSKSYDGNALAEYDLAHRGSGDLLGVKQHGFDALKFASFFDLELISECKKCVS